MDTTNNNKNPKESGSPKKPTGVKNSANQLAGMKASGQPILTRAVAHEAGRNQALGLTAAAGTFQPDSSNRGGVVAHQPSGSKEIGVRQQTVDVRVGAQKADAAAATNPNAPKTTTFAERKSAAKVLQNLHDFPEQEMTRAKQASIEWARKILPAFVPAATREAAQKRTLARDESQEENRVTPVAKRKKTQGTPKQLSFAEVAKDRVVIGVLDRNHPEGQIPRAQWRFVEAALALKTFEVLEEHPGPPPSCQDAGWLQGHTKIVACDDERSVMLYKAAIAKLGEVYPGARLEAVDWEDVPSRPRARVFVPITPADPDTIVKLFKLCNPHLPADNWKVVKLEEPRGATRQIVVLLNKESIGPLERTAGVVNYGFGKVTIKVYRSDTEADKTRPPADLEVETEPTVEEEEEELLANSQSSTTTADLADKFKKLYREKDGSESDDTLVGGDLDHGEGTPNKPPPL